MSCIIFFKAGTNYISETYLALGSWPVSVFKEGRFAGGRLAEGTFPRLCIPCLRLS